MANGLMELQGGTKQLADDTPNKRLGTAEDIAAGLIGAEEVVGRWRAEKILLALLSTYVLGREATLLVDMLCLMAEACWQGASCRLGKYCTETTREHIEYMTVPL